jgi:uncharacterized coiled-coil DUF342 family protein
VENAVYEAMKERLEIIEIAKKERSKPDIEAEQLKAEIIRLDNEIRGLLNKLAEADKVLFDYIQDRVKSLHERKNEIETRLRDRARKHKVFDTAPLADPLKRWSKLNTDEKHALAALMIDVVYVSDEKGVEIKFSV